jgi:hypothetical protein
MHGPVRSVRAFLRPGGTCAYIFNVDFSNFLILTLILTLIITLFSTLIFTLILTVASIASQWVLIVNF